MIADHIADVLLRTARNPHPLRVNFSPPMLRGRHGTGDLPRPFAIFLIDPSLLVGTRLLCNRQGQDQQQKRNDFRYLFQLSPSDSPFHTDEMLTPILPSLFLDQYSQSISDICESTLRAWVR